MLQRHNTLQLVLSSQGSVDELGTALDPAKVFFGLLRFDLGQGSFARTKCSIRTPICKSYPSHLKPSARTHEVLPQVRFHSLERREHARREARAMERHARRGMLR
jgi:hypothetical protein